MDFLHEALKPVSGEDRCASCIGFVTLMGRVSVGAEMLLTLHGYAGGFWEERDEEEVEEVDEGQYIVPEQTCCGEKISKHILESSTVFVKSCKRKSWKSIKHKKP